MMLSGLGPKQKTPEPVKTPKNKKPPPDKIENTDIDLVHRLPMVGKCLQDRYEVPIVATLCDRFKLLDELCLSSKHEDPLLKEWIEKKDTPTPTNVYATNGGLIGVFKKSRHENKVPDLFMFAGGGLL